MVLLETALEQLTGRAFKKFLRKHTNNPVKAILSGVFITTILQSSSVVSLMVLAFVGAGIIELRNAIGIILGSNLGTTFTGWIVAYFGFSFNIESFAFPFLAFGGLSMVFFAKETKWYQLGQLLVGFGFLFLGLEYMKSSIAVWASEFDISPFVGQSPYLFFGIGFVLTAIIQSSSAAMVITLSALSAQLIPLESAAAMVIGNDLGTTITVLIGGFKGTSSKKRVALSHFLFNLIVDVIALIFLFPLLHLITKFGGMLNPMMTLVAFHSSFNLLGIIIFLPFLGVFARFLEKRFLHIDHLIAQHITDVPASVPEAAVVALRQEIQHLVRRIFVMNTTMLKIENEVFKKEPFYQQSAIDQYDNLKELEGEITEFQIKIQQRALESDTAATLAQLTDAIRHAMSSAKGIKDIAHNINDFSRSVNDDLITLLVSIKQNQLDYYQSLWAIFQHQYPQHSFEKLNDLNAQSKQNYNEFLEKSYAIILSKRLTDIEISTVFNVNREIHSSNKSLVLAIKDLLLEDIQAKDFELLEGN